MSDTSVSRPRDRGASCQAPAGWPSDVEVGGVDVGLTFLAKTSGVCRTGPSGHHVACTYCDRESRLEELGRGELSVLAVDAPIVPGRLHYDVRSCEKVFVWGAFQRRCKPGESHVPGSGQALRRAGFETTHSLASAAPRRELCRDFPRVVSSSNIVEAFPNAFLGVALDEETFSKAPKRGEKFDWLYTCWRVQRQHEAIQAMVDWPRPEFWDAISTNAQHDQRAALVCALTALCVARGRYVAVGDERGGYFFLPPWPLWQPWARQCFDANRNDRRLAGSVTVWIDGVPYASKVPLPPPEAAS
jgi:predicted RNase H-like nuclease